MTPNTRHHGLSSRCGSDHPATKQQQWGAGGAGELKTKLLSVCEEFRLGPKVIGTRAADQAPYTQQLLAEPCTLSRWELGHKQPRG